MSGITFNNDGTLTFPFNGYQALFIPTDGLTGFNRDNHTGYGNLTLFLQSNTLCTISTCDLTLANFDYIPNLGGNVFFAVVFAVYLIINVFLGIRYKSWGYATALFFGLLGEILGYVGRILLWKTPFDPSGNDFLIYLVDLTIAPAFMSAAIYLCLGRIVVIYGEHLSRFRPGIYTLLFCGCDLFSLVLQAAGGGLASTSHSSHNTQIGVNVMLAGLSVQVASLALFAVLCADFILRLYKNPQSWSMEYANLYGSKLWKAFLIGLGVATLAIFIRSTFRVAELSGGFHGPLANNEVSFMILEGTMIVIATTCLTFLHPGIAFQGAYAAANWTFKGKKRYDAEKAVDGETTPQSAVSVRDGNGVTPHGNQI